MQKFIKVLLALIFIPIMTPIMGVGFIYAMVVSAFKAGLRNWETFTTWMSTTSKK